MASGYDSSLERERLLGQTGCVVWLTGLSGSGKTTIARLLEARLLEAGHLSYVLDGDVIRAGLNRDLGFATEDRRENIRRAGEVAALFADAGVIVVTAFISPFEKDRRRVRARVPAGRFLEIYLSAPLEVCERRDPKRLYAKARAGEIPDFTGIGSPYEPPLNPDLTLDTVTLEPSTCVELIFGLLESREMLAPPANSEGPAR